MAQWWEALELQRLPAAEFPGGPGSSLPASMLGLKLCYDVVSRISHEKVVLFLHRSWPRSAFCLRSDWSCLYQFDQLVSYGHWSLWYIITPLLHHYDIIITSLFILLLHHYYKRNFHYYIIITYYYIIITYYYLLIITHYYNFIITYYYVIITSLLRHYYVIMLRACSM